MPILSIQNASAFPATIHYSLFVIHQNNPLNADNRTLSRTAVGKGFR